MTDAESGMTNPRQLHDKFPVVDGHADTPQRFVDEGWSFSDPLNGGMLNLEAAREGGLAAEFFAVWVEPIQWRGRYARRTLQLIDGVYEQLRKHPATMRLGLTPDDIRQAYKDGVFSVLMGIEGGHSIEDDLGLLRLYHRLGVRYMTLTWSNTNAWADSSGDIDDTSVTHHNGLTAFGRKVVREMNDLGMMVDVSHASDATFWHVLETTRSPIIASHSSARALTQSARNLTDDQIRAVAKNKGLVMVNFYPSFIDNHWRTSWAATSAQRESLYAAVSAPYLAQGVPVPYSAPLEVDRKFYAEHLSTTLPLSPLSTLIDHIEHITKIAGIDHVGLGSDFDGFAILPAELKSAADMPKITAALMQRGFNPEQLEKLLGGNLLRVFGEIQAAAAR